MFWVMHSGIIAVVAMVIARYALFAGIELAPQAVPAE